MAALDFLLKTKRILMSFGTWFYCTNTDLIIYERIFIILLPEGKFF